jgi:hypothetical protein
MTTALPALQQANLAFCRSEQQRQHPGRSEQQRQHPGQNMELN